MARCWQVFVATNKEYAQSWRTDKNEQRKAEEEEAQRAPGEKPLADDLGKKLAGQSGSFWVQPPENLDRMAAVGCLGQLFQRLARRGRASPYF